MATKKKVKAPKFKVGDMVYSYQNPTVKRAVTIVRPSDDPTYSHQYKVGLRDREGYSYSSHWMGEKSLYKTKRKKY